MLRLVWLTNGCATCVRVRCFVLLHRMLSAAGALLCVSCVVYGVPRVLRVFCDDARRFRHLRHPVTPHGQRGNAKQQSTALVSRSENPCTLRASSEPQPLGTGTRGKSPRRVSAPRGHTQDEDKG